MRQDFEKKLMNELRAKIKGEICKEMLQLSELNFMIHDEGDLLSKTRE